MKNPFFFKYTDDVLMSIIAKESPNKLQLIYSIRKLSTHTTTSHATRG